jgi:transcriptional repressor NrdR
MICPYCKKDNDKVTDTRSIDGGLEIRRRRECLDCNRRFTSYEKVDFITVKVIKKDEKEEPFDIRKVIKSVEVACRKTTISDDQIKEIGDIVEKISLEVERKKISSMDIGDIIMKELKNLDPVAFVRFSSVYREYTNVDQFISALQGMKKS